MTYFNRAFIHLKRHPGKTGMLFVLIFLLGTLSSGAISIRQAIIALERELMSNVPAVATLLHDAEAAALDLEVSVWDLDSSFFWESPDVAEVEAVAALSYVRSYDMNLNGTLFSFDLLWAAPPVDFNLIEGHNLGDLEGMVQNRRYWGGTYESFPIRGVHNPDLTDIQSGLISLALGRTPTLAEIEAGSPVAVVSADFAAANNLGVGSLLSLQNLVGNVAQMNLEGITDWNYRFEPRFLVLDETVELEIIGIYNVETEFDADLFQGWEIADYLERLGNLTNRIYLPLPLANRLIQDQQAAELTIAEEMMDVFGGFDPAAFEAGPRLEASFLLNDPRDMAAFSEAADELLSGFWRTENLMTAHSAIIGPMDNMLALGNLILWVSIGATLLILTLLVTFLVRERQNEIGIYLGMGEKKHHILLQFWLEIFLVSTVAIAFSLLVGNALAGHLSSQLLESALYEAMSELPVHRNIHHELLLFTPPELTIEDIFSLYDTGLNWQAALFFAGTGFLTIFLSSFIPLCQILRLQPKQILLK